MLFVCVLYFVSLLCISEAWHGQRRGSSKHAYVKSKVYYTRNGIGDVQFESAGQETFSTEEEFLMFLGEVSDYNGLWQTRLSCQGLQVTVDTYGLRLGAMVEQEGTCDLIVFNDKYLTVFDIGVENATSDGNQNITGLESHQAAPCMSVHNASLLPGVYSMLVDCKGLQCPISRDSCLLGANLFDTKYRNMSTPLVSYVNKQLEVSPEMSIISDCKGNSTFHWRMYKIDGSDVLPITVHQPGLDVLEVSAQTLAPGLYLVLLEIELTDSVRNDTYDEDYLYVRVVFPELVASLKGATARESNGSETIVFDASGSHDLVTSTQVTSDVLTTSWSVLSTSGISDVDAINCVATFPYCTILESGSIAWHNISDPHQSKYLYLDTSLFPDNSSVFVIFTIARGSRVSSAIQSVYINSQVWPMSLSCLFNCPSSAKGKMAYNRLELDLSQEMASAKYTWSAMRLVNDSFANDPILTNKLGIYNRTLYVSKSDIEEGITYLFKASVSLSVDGQQYQTRVGYVKTVNYLPYGGSCTISLYSGDATVQKFRVVCSAWLDEGERTSRDPTVDKLAYLTYAIVQTTTGAYIEEETIAVSDSPKIFFFMKPGDPIDDDKTNITVQIIDIFGDAATVNFTVQSIPIIDISGISADSVGARKVQDYMVVVRNRIARKKRNTPALKLSIVTSAAEQLNQIPLPRKPSEIAKTVDGEEGVLLDIDLADTNTSASITFKEYYINSIQSEIDPATYEIQQAFEFLALTAYNVLVLTVPSAVEADNQRYLNQLTQCFTNLLAIREYANTNTKNYVVEGLHILAEASGSIWVEQDGLSAEEEEGENALIDMTSGTVNTVVPNDLNQARTVYNMDSARSQIDDMVVIGGENMTKAISEAPISPSERAYLYLKVQEKLKYDLDSVRDLARSSAASIVNVSRSILSTTEVCLSCVKTVGTGLNRQKITSMTSSELGQTTLELNTASVRLNSLANEGDTVQNVLMMQLEKNIFMYDSDGTSSQVVGGVTHLEMSDNSQLQDTVTFEQTVDHVDAQLIDPIVYEEDVSQFSLHKFIYRNTKDNLCLRVEPSSNGVQEYKLYIRFTESPTILDYDIKTSVTGSNKWLVCLEASRMNGHSGMTYLGVKTEFKSSDSTSTSSDVYPPYMFTVVTVACLNWEEASETWRNDQCKLNWDPDADFVRCICHDIKDLTFGNSFFVAPNTIDLSTAFLKFSPLSQAAVIATLCIIVAIYIVVMLWARRHDRRDIYKSFGFTDYIVEF